jgi:hypothetical protein
MSSQLIDLRPLCSMAVLAVGFDDTQKLENLEQKFLNEGGFTERLYRERQNQRRLHG